MHRRRVLAAFATAAMLPMARAQGLPPELRVEWPQAPAARRHGQGRLRFFGLAVCDVTLWAPARLASEDFERQALALEISYLRRLSGERIAERSLAEMQRAGPIDETQAARWLDAMKRLFPDVGDGDRLTGVQWPGVSARFHHNGRYLGELPDARFAALFFGIWLAPWTSEPALRRALLESAG
jgi:hypothetical protein